MRAKEYIGATILVLSFIVAVFLTHKYEESIVLYLDFGYLGMLLYISLNILATILPTFSAVPLIPAGVVLWGPFATTILNITSWMIGSVIAFSVARYYGLSLVGHLSFFEKVSKYEKTFNEKRLFWNIVLLHFIIPVDVLSYAIGIFTRMSLVRFFLATLLGITPFAFVFSYLTQVPILYQAIFFVVVAVVIYLGNTRFRRLVHAGNP